MEFLPRNSFLVRASSSYTFLFPKLLRYNYKKQVKSTNKITLVILKKPSKNKRNQLLLATVSPHKAVYTLTISMWLVDVLSLAGTETSTFKGH